MEKKTLIVPFERKAASESGEFEGYGSVFGNVDYDGDRIEKGAFTKSLMIWAEKQQLPAMPWLHNIGDLIGDYIEMREDEHGLFVKGKLWVEGDKRLENAVKAHNMLTGSGPKGLSIGYRVDEYSYEDVEGKNIRVIKSLSLFEVSIVPFGANPEALITSAKAMKEDGTPVSKRDFEKLLRKHLSISQKQAKALLSGGYDAIQRDVEDSDDQNRDGDGWKDLGEAVKQLSLSLKGK